jgi:hypothetical protein
MISSLSQLNSLPVLLVMYESGSSGEFFASTLSQVFSEITKSPNEYCAKDRVLFVDLLGRSLLTGDACQTDLDLVFERVNLYLNHQADCKDLHLVIAHPQQRYKDFVLDNFPNWRSITIIHDTLLSQQFVQNSLMSKLGMKHRARLSAENMHWRDHNNLNIEWEELILGPADQVFDKIQDFIGYQGNFELFQQLRNEYLERNSELLNLIGQKPFNNIERTMP